MCLPTPASSDLGEWRDLAFLVVSTQIIDFFFLGFICCKNGYDNFKTLFVAEMKPYNCCLCELWRFSIFKLIFTKESAFCY